MVVMGDISNMSPGNHHLLFADLFLFTFKSIYHKAKPENYTGSAHVLLYLTAAVATSQ